MKTTINTYNGIVFDLAKPNPERITLQDIAHSLATTARFVGHAVTPYSNAQHSVRVANLLPEHKRKQGILHDAKEVYIGDLSTPLKNMMPPAVRLWWEGVEVEHDIAIGKRFDLPECWWLDEEVKAADSIITAAEGRDYVAGWFITHPEAKGVSLNVAIEPVWHWELAERVFLSRAYLYGLK